MEFQINIDMANSAFANNRKAELATLLTKVVRKIWSGEIDVSQPLYVLVLDRNGNWVGEMSVLGSDGDA